MFPKICWGRQILNGLKPDIATYVTQRNPQSLEELLAAAQVAELTSAPARDTSLYAKVDRLMDTWEKLSTAQVQELTCSRPQSPNSNLQRVTFNEGQTQYMGEARSRQYRGPQIHNSDRPRPNFDRMRTPQMGQGFRSPGYNQVNNPYPRDNPGIQMQQGQRYNTPSSSAQICFKCGRQAHSHINYCPYSPPRVIYVTYAPVVCVIIFIRELSRKKREVMTIY